MTLLASVAIAAAIGAGCAALLHCAARTLPADSETLVARIDALLPQTQCGQCGHPGCRPYAKALAAGAPIDRCPPGGQALVDALAELLARPQVGTRFDPRWQTERVAAIHEPDCIGCARCLAACPVDAIVGAPRQMHTVLQDECTGCELCLPECPVDCIEMEART